MEFPVVHLSSSGNHPDPWSAVHFIEEHLFSASKAFDSKLKCVAHYGIGYILLHLSAVLIISLFVLAALQRAAL